MGHGELLRQVALAARTAEAVAARYPTDRGVQALAELLRQIEGSAAAYAVQPAAAGDPLAPFVSKGGEEARAQSGKGGRPKAAARPLRFVGQLLPDDPDWEALLR